jgi:hypothetical protein
MCIFMPNVIHHIIEKQVTQNIMFPNMDIPKLIYNLTLLLDMQVKTTTIVFFT